jgi:hypothetical protein
MIEVITVLCMLWIGVLASLSIFGLVIGGLCILLSKGTKDQDDWCGKFEKKDV